jgi:hypothetical protein
VDPWATATLALVGLRRPKLALFMVAAHAGALRRNRPSTSMARAAKWSISAVARTGEGIGRAGVMFVAPGLVAALCMRATRRPALVLLAGSPLARWAWERPSLDPLRWTSACLADDLAYGAGVWYGCVAQRVLEPLMPTVARASRHDGRRTEPVAPRLRARSPNGSGSVP